MGIPNEKLTVQSKGDAPVARPPDKRAAIINWLPLAPFFLFAVMFLFLPSVSIFFGSFKSVDGGFTFDGHHAQHVGRRV